MEDLQYSHPPSVLVNDKVYGRHIIILPFFSIQLNGKSRFEEVSPFSATELSTVAPCKG